MPGWWVLPLSSSTAEGAGDACGAAGGRAAVAGCVGGAGRRLGDGGGAPVRGVAAERARVVTTVCRRSGLGDRSSRPRGCPHQMSPVTEAKIVEIRRVHPVWGADRIGYQLERDGIGPVPGRTSICRPRVRTGLVVPGQRRRRRADYRRWERARPMELWQIDVVGGFHLVDGTEL